MSEPSEPIECRRHGRSHATFVCAHLVRNAGLGFYTSDEDPEDPRPDAWCSVCEAVAERAGGWTDESQAFAEISVICAGCYDLCRRRNAEVQPIPTKTPYICSSCSALHTELPLDFASPTPRSYDLLPAAERDVRAVLTSDTCVIDGAEWYVRGVIEIVILDLPARWRWGVWVSLSEASYARYQALRDSDEGVRAEPMFGWLNTRLPFYPHTDGLATNVRLRSANLRPYVEFHAVEHPLAAEQADGIPFRRVAELLARLGHGAAEVG